MPKSPPVCGARKINACWAPAGTRNDDPLFAGVFVPGFNFCEPVLGRWIGRTAQERGNHEETHGLPIRHVGMDPNAIPRLQIWHPRNRQSLAGPGYPYFYSWPGQVKRRRVSVKQISRQKYESQEQEIDPTKHVFILRGSKPLMGCQKGKILFKTALK